MISLLVTSKTMNLDTTPPKAWVGESLPRFQKDAAQLTRALKKLSRSQLRSVMQISDKLADQTQDRLKSFQLGDDPGENSRPAGLAFTGDVYQSLASHAFTKSDVHFASKHVRILSGLYGYLSPTDRIQAYRLEPGYLWGPNQKYPNLVHFWKSKVTRALLEDLEALPASQRVVLNLLSNEFNQLVDWKQIPFPVVVPAFKEKKAGKLKVVALFAKKARGMMARYQIKERIRQSEALKSFHEGDYRFDAESSDSTNWLFWR